MGLVIYDVNEVSRMDGGSIVCVDHNGARRIDLAQCGRNWESSHPGQGEGAGGGERCVADHDSTASPMYFLFYAEPRVMVAFPFKKGILDRLLSRPACRAKIEMRAYREFTAFARKLQQAGWRSCDLS